ncbi:MAG: hypothetical protein NTX50_20945 [Candidatus Sumerlaeota bacterium]|nr:hypothetical protein [Candidatus Sumerlaeota bacterium]
MKTPKNRRFSCGRNLRYPSSPTAVHDSAGSSNHQRVFVNGAEQTVTRVYDQGGTMANTAADLHIGDDYSLTGEFLDGAMDDVRIYSRALTEAEARRLWRGGSGTEELNPTPWSTPTPTPSASPSPSL